MEETSTLPKQKNKSDILWILMLHLFLIVFSFLLDGTFTAITYFSVTFKSYLPENFVELDTQEREEVVKQATEEYSKRRLENPSNLEMDFYNVMLKESPEILFINRIAWAIAFLLPGYWILKRFGGEPSTLSDPLDFIKFNTGAMLGFIAFLFIIFVGITFKIFNYKPSTDLFQQELIKNLKGNTYLLAWSIYTVGIITGIIEELFFRGFLLKHYIEKGFAKEGLLFTSVLFGSMHYAPGVTSISVPIILTLIGGFFGLAYLRTGNIWVSIFAHSVYNSLSLIAAYFVGDAI